MDTEQIQFFGFSSILKESINTIFSQRKTFTQITFAFILPLSFIFLAHFHISQFLFIHHISNQDALNRSEWTAFWLLKSVYFTFLFTLSLLSTSAVVHTVASIYAGNKINFRKIMTAVPKVWKRLAATFGWSFTVLVLYNIASGTLLFVSAVSLRIRSLILATLAIPYFLGFVYITLLWHLAGVASVLENCYGIGAVIKSKALIEGKMSRAAGIFLVFCLCFFGIQIVFEFGVVLPPRWLRMEVRIAIGVFCLLMLAMVVLFGLVAETVVYFVCKSHRGELVVVDHAEEYLGDYVCLINNKDGIHV